MGLDTGQLARAERVRSPLPFRPGPTTLETDPAAHRIAISTSTCARASITSMWYNVSMKEDQRIYQERIIADPRILAGKPVVKGTRIAVDLVLEELSHNPDIADLLAAHPDLTRDDVQACLAYAKDIVTGKEVSPKPPKGGRVDAAL